MAYDVESKPRPPTPQRDATLEHVEELSFVAVMELDSENKAAQILFYEKQLEEVSLKYSQQTKEREQLFRDLQRMRREKVNSEEDQRTKLQLLDSIYDRIKKTEKELPRTLKQLSSLQQKLNSLRKDKRDLDLRIKAKRGSGQ